MNTIVSVVFHEVIESTIVEQEEQVKELKEEAVVEAEEI